jgi:hypothetical protein
MHTEDLEGDSGRCWSALRRSCIENKSHKVPVGDVKAHLRTILQELFGEVPEGYQDEAKVTSFIAGLFLTHRGFASISQEVVPDGEIFLEDLWPEMDDFQQVKDAIDELDQKQNIDSQNEDSGSVQFAKKRAEKIRLIEEAERKAKELELEEEESKEVAIVEVSQTEDEFNNHEWLVE